MSDNSELKRLAEHHLSLGQAYTVAKPSVLLALIAENERLSADCSSMRGSLKANAVSIKKLIKDGGRAARERDQLRAEISGLKTGYEAYERVNAELKAENEELRANSSLVVLLPELDSVLEDLEIHGQHSDQGYRKLKDWYRKVDLACKAIDAALGRGEQS